MKISIGKIETEEISEVSHSDSLKIAGGKTQYADINIYGSAGDSSAGASVYLLNSGENPVSEFGASIDVLETTGESSSISNSFVNLR